MRADAKALRAPLLRWYRKHKRDLPWRRTQDPYAIWVSEAMLQQTTVAAVIPYWHRFLARFPNIAALARATEEEVLAMWTGLGYYRRARALREGAIKVLERHRGMIPGDRESLLALPGIGPYTAGAIASVAFGHPEPIVDGNVKRVFSRLFAIKGNGAAVDKKHWRIARTMVDGPHPGDLNQALMELGATVCTPRSPECKRCPIAKACRAKELGRQASFPVAAVRKAMQDIDVAVAWIERSGRILLERRHRGSPLRGTWDLPIVRGLPSRIGLEMTAGEPLGTVRHTILNRRLTISVVPIRLEGLTPRATSLLWVRPSELPTVATSAATVKAVHAASSTLSSGSSGRVKRHDLPSIKGTAPKAQSSPAQ